MLAEIAGTAHTGAMTQLLERLVRSSEDPGARANTLRAGVLGANDGIVSVAAIVVGVAGASAHEHALLVAGLAALIGGAISMALGEYVSVSSQRDSERARDLDGPNPWAAAAASAAAFTVGGVLPLVAILAAQGGWRVPVTVLTVLVALALTGAAGARLGGVAGLRPAVRTIVGGGLALALTWLIGTLLGTAGGL